MGKLCSKVDSQPEITIIQPPLKKYSGIRDAFGTDDPESKLEEKVFNFKSEGTF